jgi:DNA-directed RNA polymerase specialized sigma subunit
MVDEAVKRYLDNIRNYNGITNAYNEQLLTIRLIGYTAPISNYNNVGGSSGTQRDSVQERYITALEECEEKIRERASKYANAIERFYEELEQVPNSLHRLVLLLYYASKKSIKEIAKELDKCESAVKKYLEKAREEFAKVRCIG